MSLLNQSKESISEGIEKHAGESHFYGIQGTYITKGDGNFPWNAQLHDKVQ